MGEDSGHGICNRERSAGLVETFLGWPGVPVESRHHSDSNLSDSIFFEVVLWLSMDAPFLRTAHAMQMMGTALRKMYWLIVVGIPLLPPYVLFKYHSSLACSENGICFRYGHPFLNGDGLAIVDLSMALLWPICIWQLIGKHLPLRRLRSGFVMKFHTRRVAIWIAKLFWLMVAAIPLLFWYLFGTFQAPVECVGNGDCFEFYAPLDGTSKAAVLITCCLLWPLCLWKLFGHRILPENSGHTFKWPRISRKRPV
jgi:hypothetical protein